MEAHSAVKSGRGSCRKATVPGCSGLRLPEGFVGTPVACLAGIRVSEPKKLQSIAEGQTIRALTRYLRGVETNLPARRRARRVAQGPRAT